MIIYCFSAYSPDLSGKFYGTVYFSTIYAYYILSYASGKKSLKYSVWTGEKIFTVYIPDISDNFFGTAHFISFYFFIFISFYSPDLSCKLYGTVYFSPFYAYFILFYASGKKI